jgi:hypothetical protein
MQSEAHRVSAPYERRGAGNTSHQFLLVYTANRLRAAAGVLVVARHAKSYAPGAEFLGGRVKVGRSRGRTSPLTVSQERLTGATHAPRRS